MSSDLTDPRRQRPRPRRRSAGLLVAVVRAYVAAVDARDFRTADAIDARADERLSRFSRPGHLRVVGDVRTRAEGDAEHVTFRVDVEGGDGTLEDGPWGYYLERGHDGRWQIVDAGVA